jgi:Mg2+ and Co2+ transporter CorA
MIEQTTRIPKPEELIGLQNTAATIEKLVQGMQGDTGNEPKMKEFAKALNQLNNEIKKLQQHLQMEMQKQQQQNGNGDIQKMMMETQAKIQGKTAETQQKLKAKELAEMQKRRHKDTAFVADQQRQNIKTVADIARQSRQPLERE